MNEDDPSSNGLDQLARRLDRLEEAMRAQATRLQQIEQYLSRAPRSPEADARDERRHPYEPLLRTQQERHAQQTPPAPTTGAGAQTPPPPAHEQAQAREDAAARRDAPAHDAAPQRDDAARRRDEGAGRSGEAATGNERSSWEGVPLSGYGNAAGARAAGATRRKESRRSDFESLIGGSWFLWIGIIAVSFGVAFFLKWAFESQWIGPTGRVMLGAAAGVGFLALGERLRWRGLRQYAYVLSGGGILILYLSIYAAYGFYQLIAQLPAFLLMIAVTATAVLLSARLDALPIAILGLVGGFLTPILLSTGRDNETGLFSYIALLDAGVLTLAYLKRWRSLYYMSFVATLMMITGWATIHYAPEKLWTTVFFTSLFFLLFSLLAVVHNVLPRRPAAWFDITLIIANATFYFSMNYGMLNQAGYHSWLGSFALTLSAFYVLLFYLAWSRHPADRLLNYSLVGAGITFFTLALAIQLDGQWVTIGWACEAAVLAWVGLRAGVSAPRHASIFVFSVAVTHWLTIDLFNFAARNSEAAVAFTPLLNSRAAACAALVAASAIIVRLYRQAGGRVTEEERSVMTTAFTLAGNLLAFTILTLDTDEYFQRQKALVGGQTGNGNEAVGRLENARLLTLTALWTLYGAAALAIGIVRRVRALRLAALALLVCTVFKVLTLDLDFAAARWHTTLLNPTFAAFTLLVVALAVCASLYGRAESHIAASERTVVLPALVVAANLLAIVALSAEAQGYFEREIALGGLDEGRLRDLHFARQLSLSIIWMLYGAGALLFGRLRGNRLLRVTALLLLGVTTLKVFFWDLSSLERVYRIISFIVLGLILLAISYFYQKSQQRPDEVEAEAENA